MLKSHQWADGVRDGKQKPGAVYSDVVEIGANFFDKP